MKPRDYQREAIARTWEKLKEGKSTLISMPTGTGKTVVFGCLIKEWREGKRP